MCSLNEPFMMQNVDINQLLRWSIIDRLFRTGLSFTASNLTEDVNDELRIKGKPTVSKRTIYTDLNEMELIFGNKIIIEKDGRNKFKYKNKRSSIFNIGITEDQRNTFDLLLKMSEKLLLPDEFTRIRLLVEDLYGKSNIETGEDNKQYNKIYLATSDSSSNEKRWIEVLYESIINRKAIIVYYKKYAKPTTIKKLSVYGIKEYNGRWYMVAYDHELSKGNNPKVYKLDNIKDLKSCEEDYIKSDSFDIEDYFKYCIGIFHDLKNKPEEVILEINNSVTIDRILLNPINQTQEIIEKTQDKLVTKLTVYNTIELTHTIFSLGKDVKIISPAEVRKNYKKYLLEILENV